MYSGFFKLVAICFAAGLLGSFVGYLVFMRKFMKIDKVLENNERLLANAKSRAKVNAIKQGRRVKGRKC